MGRDLLAFRANVVKKQGMEIMINTPAKKLVQHPATKEILGLRAETGDKEIAIKARKAVILTCGGFAGNFDLLRTFIDEAPVPMYVSGTFYSTGDGIKMAIDVGADLWHMNAIEWSMQGTKVPDFPAAF